jgi:hypothetical protein
LGLFSSCNTLGPIEISGNSGSFKQRHGVLGVALLQFRVVSRKHVFGRGRFYFAGTKRVSFRGAKQILAEPASVGRTAARWDTGFVGHRPSE